MRSSGFPAPLHQCDRSKLAPIRWKFANAASHVGRMENERGRRTTDLANAPYNAVRPAEQQGQESYWQFHLELDRGSQGMRRNTLSSGKRTRHGA